MGDHGDSKALPTVLCASEAPTPWVPVTSPIPGLTALPIGAQVMNFPLPTDVLTVTTHPPHGETDPDGPMGEAGASEPTASVEALSYDDGMATSPVPNILRPPDESKPRKKPRSNKQRQRGRARNTQRDKSKHS